MQVHEIPPALTVSRNEVHAASLTEGAVVADASRAGTPASLIAVNFDVDDGALGLGGSRDGASGYC